MYHFMCEINNSTSESVYAFHFLLLNKRICKYMHIFAAQKKKMFTTYPSSNRITLSILHNIAPDGNLLE